MTTLDPAGGPAAGEFAGAAVSGSGLLAEDAPQPILYTDRALCEGPVVFLEYVDGKD